MSFDVVIQGQGVFMIDPLSERAKQWIEENIRGEQTWLHDMLACEGSRNTRAIVAGMVRDGLNVEVNGVDMKGFGQ